METDFVLLFAAVLGIAGWCWFLICDDRRMEEEADERRHYWQIVGKR